MDTMLLCSDGSVDHVFSKTTKGVVFKVCSRQFILRVLVATNSASTYFALFGSGTCEEVTGPAFVILEDNIGLNSQPLEVKE
jgi:hypothetical protein